MALLMPHAAARAYKEFEKCAGKGHSGTGEPFQGYPRTWQVQDVPATGSKDTWQHQWTRETNHILLHRALDILRK